MTTSWRAYGALLFLFAGICICGCVTDEGAYSSALSLYQHAETRISEIDWDTSPPELTDAKLQGAEVDLNEALVIVDTLQPDPASGKPSAEYALRELIFAKQAYVSAARDVSSAQMHILNAGDAAELYQYADWYLEMHAAMGNLALADAALSLSDSRMNGIKMGMVPVEMRSDIAEAKGLNANFAGLITSLERSVELALEE
ncbi:hypothetical protein L1S32_01845 [Methanogenium sp. S4BF]|uniref:hypothetical protein n=1 Tax=Methanogenium sp. S4BF TaxID=1789226 RepID=UPI002417D386|nr:hypothetical protein [Methanogenium sp. S4BF]WFN34885.1 hypothetical protein L1S32_01845 [Methanogenium sp. S4BF]